MKFNVSAASEIYEEIADIADVPDGVTDRADAAVEAVRSLFAKIGIPVGLDALGVSSADVEWVAERAILSTRLVENNRRELDQDAAAGIVREALASLTH
jgi:alcohol dehydrogenase class IV